MKRRTPAAIARDKRVNVRAKEARRVARAAKPPAMRDYGSAYKKALAEVKRAQIAAMTAEEKAQKCVKLTSDFTREELDAMQALYGAKVHNGG